jgi:hypothetical protein
MGTREEREINLHLPQCKTNQINVTSRKTVGSNNTRKLFRDMEVNNQKNQ